MLLNTSVTHILPVKMKMMIIEFSFAFLEDEANGLRKGGSTVPDLISCLLKMAQSRRPSSLYLFCEPVHLNSSLHHFVLIFS